MAQERLSFAATVRERVGKGAARHVRREGKIPAVIYGNKKPAQSIALDYHDVSVEYFKGNLISSVVEVNVDGTKNVVIPRDFQIDPVRDIPVHIDFMRIAADGLVTVEVAVHFINEESCPAIKAGGSINVVRHEVEVECPFEEIPEQFEVDLDGRDIGDTIHVSDIKLPDRVKPTIDDRDFTIATLVAPRVAEEISTEAPEAPVTEIEGENADDDEKKDD